MAELDKKATSKTVEKREDLVDWLEENDEFRNDIAYARKQLGLDTLRFKQTRYKNFDEALEDLVYQLWCRDGQNGDFEEDILEKSKLSDEPLDYEKFYSNPWNQYVLTITKVADEVLSGFRITSRYLDFLAKSEETKNMDFLGPKLDGGFRKYVVAKIASPDEPQFNIEFKREIADDYPISILEANSDEVVVKIRGGATKGDVTAIWQACKPILVQPTSADTIENAMLCCRPLDVSKESHYHTTSYDMAIKFYLKDGNDKMQDQKNIVSEHIHKIYRYKSERE